MWAFSSLIRPMPLFFSPLFVGWLVLLPHHSTALFLLWYHSSLLPCYFFWTRVLQCLPYWFLIVLLPLVFIAQYSYWASLFNASGFLGPFYSLGILGLFHSFLPLTFPWAFAKSFGLPWPNYHLLCLWVYWLLNQSHLLLPCFGLLGPFFSFFLFLIIPMG